MPDTVTLTSRSHFLGVATLKGGSNATIRLVLNPGNYEVIKENKNSVVINHLHTCGSQELSKFRIAKKLLEYKNNNYIIKKFSKNE